MKPNHKNHYWINQNGVFLFVGATRAAGKGTDLIPAGTVQHPQFTAIRRAMPAGSELATIPASFGWYKRGGYAGSKMLSCALEKFEALGFKNRAPAVEHSSPDGSTIGHRRIYTNQNGDELTYSQRYGVTAADNRFSLTVTFRRD